MFTLLMLHLENQPHMHPDQMAVALLLMAAGAGVTWFFQRRRS